MTLNEIKSCVFNDDDLTVNVVFSDNSKISILVTQIEDSLGLNVTMQSKIDWLLYNDLTTFVELVLSSELQTYLARYSESYSEQENNIQKQLEKQYSPETAREITREFMMYSS